METNKTNVIPFTNATDYEQWQNANCHGCKKYECESEHEEQAGCKPAFHLDLATILGTMPLWAAEEIGCKYHPGSKFVRLDDACKLFNHPY